MKTSYLNAALVADALSLGSHWIYNQSKLARSYPEGVVAFSDPLSQYHPGKQAGDLTHYGDQMRWLAECVQGGMFHADTWRVLWLERIAKYKGYVDGASKESLVSRGLSPSGSNDLAGASRIAPLLDLDMDLEERVQAARAQTVLTHGDADVVDAAEFFVRAVEVYQGDMREAFEYAASEGNYESLNVVAELQKVAEVDAENYLEASSKIGLTCHFPEAFPLTLYFALHHGGDFLGCMSKNALAGGDTSARAMLLALFFKRSHAADIDGLVRGVSSSSDASDLEVQPGSNALSIPSLLGALRGVLEMPIEKPKAYALFAHCFTCGKDFTPEARITKELAKRGIATLRIDFSGVGASEVAFKETSFLTNVGDLQEASTWLEAHFEAPQLLVGHSLGGAAVLAAAAVLPHTKAVVTIGAPADPSHVTHFFEEFSDEIMRNGEAVVSLAGRDFVVGQKFLEDLRKHNQKELLETLRVHTLIMHSPEDSVVPLENAGLIYSALKHPKSFISLPQTDHLLTKGEDVRYVSDMIATWSQRVLSR